MTDKDYVIALSALLDKTEEDLTKDYGEPLSDAAIQNLLKTHSLGIIAFHRRISKLTMEETITSVIFASKSTDELVQMANETFEEMVRHPVGWYYDGNNVLHGIYYRDDYVQSLLGQILTTEDMIREVSNREAVNKEEAERNGEYIFFLKDIQMKYYEGNNILCDGGAAKFLMSVYDLERRIENMESVIEKIKNYMEEEEDE